jgi:multiple sugar transport system substrate-binding protein
MPNDRHRRQRKLKEDFRFVCMTLFAATLCFAPAAHAGEQAEKALAAVRQLQASGEVPPGTMLRLTVKQGNIAAFLGRNFELQREWEKNTGIPIDANLMPQLDSQKFIERAVNVDLTIARNHEYPDLMQHNLIEDLTPLMRRFGFSLARDEQSGYVLVKQQAYLGDSVVAIPADGDVPLLYLRRDLLEDPANRARYREKYGRELAVPKTWSEYLDQVAFFNRAHDGFYGALEQRERNTCWMFWIPRYAVNAQTPFLFDEKMHPLIDSPAGIAATENYLATVPFSPPKILDDGNDYSYTLPFFMGGKGYSTIITPAGAKLFNLDTSPIKDKFVAVPLPGHMQKNRLLRRSMLIYGNNLVIPHSAPHKALALLYAMWLSDPDISARSVAVPGGFADPYRYSHLADERIRKVYTQQALDAYRQELSSVIPSGTGLPGNSEYLAALSNNLHLAAQGKQTARDAMSHTAREWEAITERYGRDKQIRHWAAFRTQFPDDAGAPAH